jgi:excisionase family DNA binding protein
MIEQKGQPLTVRIREACRMTGIGRSKFYALIKAGQIEAVKVGAITLVPISSIEALIDRGRPAGGEEVLSRRLRAAMHPWLANAILTASVAKAPDKVRRDLSSLDADERARAEDTLVERLVVDLYDSDDDGVARSG